MGRRTTAAALAFGRPNGTDPAGLAFVESPTAAVPRALSALGVGGAALVGSGVADRLTLRSAVAVLVLAAAWELALIWSDGRGRRLTASLAIPATTLVLLGPRIGRSAVIVIVSTIFLTHLVTVGWRTMRAWPAHSTLSVAAGTAAVTAITGLASPLFAAIHVAISIAAADHASRRHGPEDPVARAMATAWPRVLGASRRARSAAGSARRRASAAGATRIRAVFRRIDGLPRWALPTTGLLVTTAYVVPLVHSLASNTSRELPKIVGWYNDFPAHLEVARRLDLVPLVMPPHPMFHIATRALSNVMSEANAAAVTLGVASVAIFAGMLQLARRSSNGAPGLGAGAAVAFAVFTVVAESPAALTMKLKLTNAVGSFASFHVWNSPTETLALGATALFLPALLDAVESLGPATHPSPATQHRRLVMLTLLATLAKPSFSMVLVPALPTFLVLSGRWRHPGAVPLVSRVLGTAGAVLVVQVGTLAAFAPPEYRVGLRWAPFEVLQHFDVAGSGPIYFAGPVIVLVGIALGGRRYVADPGVGLSWTALAVALVPMTLLAETGPFANDGNVGKLTVICWFAVFVTTVRFIAVELVRRHRPTGECASSAPPERTVSVVARTGLTVACVAYAGLAVVAGGVVWTTALTAGGS